MDDEFEVIPVTLTVSNDFGMEEQRIRPVIACGVPPAIKDDI